MDTMVSSVSIAEIGALLGDPARSNMLMALMGGQALTASELAWHAGVTAQTASGHLAKLAESGLLVPERQGRHRYFRLASPIVAQMIEGISAVAAVQGRPRYRPRSRIDDAVRTARTCYDHLAGRLGVGLADALAARGHVVLAADGGETTEIGAAFLAEFGIDLMGAARQKRSFCRPCLDWSERRPHIAGALGAKLAQRCFDLGWIERVKDSRAVAITRSGAHGFEAVFGVRLEDPPHS